MDDLPHSTSGRPELPEPEDRLAVILEGIEQLAHRIADLAAICEGMARGLDRLGARLGEVERRLDEELLNRAEGVRPRS